MQIRKAPNTVPVKMIINKIIDFCISDIVVCENVLSKFDFCDIFLFICN